MMKSFRIIVGAVFWISAVCLLWANRAILASHRTQETARSLTSFWTARTPSLRLEFPAEVEVAVSDPVFVIDGSGQIRQVGEVHSMLVDGHVAAARRGHAAAVDVLLFPTAPELGPGAEFTYFQSPDSLAWVVETLMTPERKQLIAAEVRTAYDAYRDELWRELQPVVEATLRDTWLVVERDLPGAIARHRPELDRLGTRYQREIVERELLPLAKSEIWPILRRRAEPLVDEVGMELWERVSLWRFGWRAAYDRSPLPDRRLLEHEWQRFVRAEAMPILVKHTAEMIEVVRSVIQDAADNEAVQAALRKTMAQIADDPELQQVIVAILQEVFVLNPNLRMALKDRWTGPEARQAMELASDRLEPTVRRISELLFGSLQNGITPEFAQVIRTQILAKDQRWILLEPDGSGTRLPNGTAYRVRLAGTGKQLPVTLHPGRAPTRLRTREPDGG